MKIKSTSLRDYSVHSFRWNVDPAWTNFSAMIQDGYLFGQAKTEYERHKASKSCLYFGVAAVEAFFNQELREFMRKQGLPDEEILKVIAAPKIRYGAIQDSSFGDICKDIKYKEFQFYKEIRNEVTHPSRKDQLIYDYLNVVIPLEFVRLVQYIFVKVCDMQNKEYQYWMLGWNYIGFNGNNKDLFLSNNLNGFYYSFLSMNIHGLDVSNQLSFEEDYMKGYDSFTKTQLLLNSYPFDIEPRSKFSKPRLTRKWWEHGIELK